MKFTLIPAAERVNKTCFWCGSNKSVKYVREIRGHRIYSCNLCVFPPMVSRRKAPEEKCTYRFTNLYTGENSNSPADAVEWCVNGDRFEICKNKKHFETVDPRKLVNIAGSVWLLYAERLQSILEGE